MIDHTVYHAQSRCNCTGLERIVRVFRLPDGRVIRVYRDNFNQYRAVLFKTLAHEKGYAGIALDPQGYVKHKEICPAMRHACPYRTLVAVMRSLKIVVHDA